MFRTRAFVRIASEKCCLCWPIRLLSYPAVLRNVIAHVFLFHDVIEPRLEINLRSWARIIRLRMAQQSQKQGNAISKVKTRLELHSTQYFVFL